MKRILIGLFYALQGICNFVFAIDAFTSDPKFGIGIGFFLLLPTILSFVTVWKLVQRKIDQTRALAIAVSVFFIFMHICYSNILLGYYVHQYFVLLIVLLLIIVLNVVAVLGLFSFARNKRI